MSAADIFVLPSLYEGFPNVLAEAASIGLPCIGYSDVSGVPDLIENGVSGILLSSEQRRPADLASAIESLMNNADKRAKMGRAGSVRSERFNHFRVARQWIDVIAGAGDVVSDSPSL
jgi:glycosyltransferase involved in cell wall biosynthesis